MMDALIALAVIATFIGLFLWAQLPYWVGLVCTIVLAVAVWELIAIWRTKQTLSQQMWGLGKRAPWKRWMLIGFLALAWVGLLIHLMWK